MWMWKLFVAGYAKRNMFDIDGHDDRPLLCDRVRGQVP